MIDDKLPPENVTKALGNTPDVLLGYQQHLLTMTARHPVVICEKSRRIGMTWGIGSDAVLTAASSRMARGMDVLYIGYNLDMTREFIDTCASWAKAFSQAATEMQEFLFEDGEGENTKGIKAFRIKFASGYEITALSSRPRSLRGRQGYVIIDEAAFHDDLDELLKAALAMLIWGGKVLVISTHDGVDNPFNKLLQEIDAGRLNYKKLKVDLDDALKDGLYKRICLVRGMEWTAEGEAAWRTEVVGFYGQAAQEELFCVPRKSAGAYLSAVLVESRMDESIKVVRFECDKDFVHLSEPERDRIVLDWCQANLKPLLGMMDKNLMSFLGEDFGRSGDLTVLVPIQVMKNMQRRPPFFCELRNVPFTQQKQILWFILDRLPRFGAAAMDARGNGQQLAEETMQRYGANRIHQIMANATFYLQAFPRYKAGLEDNMMLLPKDADVADDHRAAVIENGIPQIPNTRTKGADGGKRHGDSLIAAVLAYWVTQQNIEEYDYMPINPPRSDNALGDHRNDDMPQNFRNARGSF